MILLRLRPDGFVGVVTPPLALAPWIFDSPIAQRAFVERMSVEGNHPTDIGDVLWEAERSGFGYLP